MNAQKLRITIGMSIWTVAMATILVFSLFLVTGKVQANPTGFTKTAQSAVATTTFALLTPGTGTSTIVYDSYGINGTNEAQSGSTFAADTATLLVQFTASSTSSKLKVSYEYSQDNVDWYADGVTNLFASSTTGVINLAILNSFTWTFASTSLGGAGVSATNNLSTEILAVPTPTRYVRAVISVTGANAQVWAQFVPKKQNQ